MNHPAFSHLQEANDAIFEQLKELLVKLTDEQYCLSLDLFSGSSIGKHYRHILEFYQCLLEQLPDGNINYDLRQRKMELEVETHCAKLFVDDLECTLKAINEDKPLRLQSNALGETINFPSSLSRELMYVMEHAIHHMALIKAGIKSAFPEVQLDKHFGVAFSTIKHQEKVVRI